MSESIIPFFDPKPLRGGVTFESSCRYQLLRRLGQGGMGEVWLAERVSAGKHVQMVAIKFLNNPFTKKMLANEALRISRLSHDNIVPFIDSGRDGDGRFFFVMAYIHGIDLIGLRNIGGLDAEAVTSQQASFRLPDPIVGFIALMVLRALHHAHTYHFEDGEIGLIHRDVSPGNILIEETRGFVKLTDFGVAARCSSDNSDRTIAGKVPYMAPEVISGGPVDTRSDLYALGLVMYELLTGFNPNVRLPDLSSVLGAITSVMLSLEKPLRAPHDVVEGIDPDLSHIVVRLLEPRPDDRYASAEAAIADLTLCIYNRGVGPTTDSLASYIALMREPEITPQRAMQRNLTFLSTPRGELNIRPSWILTPHAQQALRMGENPCRGL